jgi:hypothetical protein
MRRWLARLLGTGAPAQWVPTRSLLAVGAIALGACVGAIGDPGDAPPLPPNAQVPNDAQAPSGAWLPVRVRRLSNRELDNSVMDLLGTTTLISTMLAPDTRQSGFTLNAGQRIDDTSGGELQTAADALSEEAVTQRLGTLVTCTYSADPRGCAATFIEAFAARAFRRPLIDDDRTGLLAVYDTGASGTNLDGGTNPDAGESPDDGGANPDAGAIGSDGGTIGTFAGGIKAIISAVLQSGSFLYVTELGRGAPVGGLVELDPYEAASQLSYVLAAAAPDPPLLAAAAQDALGTPDQREAQARRLLASNPHVPQQLARLIKEWLGLDQLANIDRASTVTDTFATLSPLFDQETDAYIGEVAAHTDGTLATLLTADFTMVNAKLASFYGVPYSGTTGWARAPLDSTLRRGLLTQSNFLSTYASTAPPGSSPVKRGKDVLNQLLCLPIQFPTDPNVAALAMVPPPVNPNGTTRQRFEEHAANPACSGCHDMLDGIGWGFENYDQIGKFRSTENGQPIDASGALLGSDVNGPFANGIGLVGRLATSEQVRQCFARNFFRFASAQTSDDTETHYLSEWQSMPANVRTVVTELLVGYIRSDLFIKRSPQ